MVKILKYVLLTFDVEEFDLLNNNYEVSFNGLNKVIEICKDINATFFVTALFAEKHKGLIKKLSKEHEVASHGYHDDNYKIIRRENALRNIKKSKEIIEKIIGKKINGFRAPRFLFRDYSILREVGFRYDSSCHPSFMFGKCGSFGKRRVFIKENIKVVPASVTPFLRLPLFWLAFRNLGLSYEKSCTKMVLMNNDFVNIVLHPWEFVDLSKYKLPWYIKRNSGRKMEMMLRKYIKWGLNNKMKFLSINEYLSKNG